MRTWEKRDEILEWDPSGNPCSPLPLLFPVTANDAHFLTQSHRCPLGEGLGSGNGLGGLKCSSEALRAG